jgi:methylated-DNA-[protein]-cysteine S-methyltransferase
MSLMVWERMPSPVGELLIVGHASALTGLHFPGVEPNAAWVPAAHATDAGAAMVHEARRQLEEYFAGARTRFVLPFDAAGTDFQQKVWAALDGIPFGDVISYAEMARRVGSPLGMRAVGAANGRNPLAIVRPCHRVIGANGSLTGFGGGLPAKRWLLQHEGVQLG